MRWLGLLLFLIGCERSASSDASATALPSASVQTRSATASSSSSGAAVALDTSNRGWVIGERYPYRLKLTSALKFGEQPNAFDFDVTGSLVVAPANLTAGEASLFVVLVSPKIQSRVADPSGQFARVSKELESFGCYFTFKSGLVADMRLAPGLSPMTVSIYRQLGAALQFARAQNNANSYEVLEYDGTGQYSARYEKQPGGEYTKRKIKYLRILAKRDTATEPALAQIVPEVVASQGRLQVSSEGRPLTIQLQDEVRVNGAQLPVHANTSISLDADPSTRGGEVRDWRALTNKLDRLAADEPFGGPATIESLDAARIKGLTFEAIVAKLRALPSASEALPASSAQATLSAAEQIKQDAQTAESSSLFVALAAIFRQDPKAIQQAIQLARTQPQLSNTLVDALGSSGSPVAHKALAELLEAKGVTPKLRQRALTGLARTPRPSPVAIEALRTELRRKPFNTDAIYGLGSYARYFRDQGDAAQHKELGDLLVERLQHANDIVPRLAIALGGITNAGYSEALSAVVPHFADRRAPVRAAAVLALQSMRGEQVDALIAGTLSSDKEYSVVLSAIDSARGHEPTDAMVQALSSVALTFGNANVRYRAVQLLLDWSKRRPEVRGTLQQVAEKDTEEQVRTLARSAT